MRQRLASTDLSIDELLSGRYAFSIPAYQRDYTWTKTEASQLVDDIAAVIDDVDRSGADTPYFIGTMLFVEQDRDQREQSAADMGNRPVEVVDGQQRLITLAILFAVLRDLLDEESGASLHALLAAGQCNYQLEVRTADAAHFRAVIQEPGASRRAASASDIGASAARRNFEDVRRAIRSKFQREFTVDERRRFADFARTNTRVLVVSSDDFDYAYQIFLTINDRGKPLSVEDIFRGEILGPLDQDQRRRYETIIDEMDKYREDAELTRAKGKTFFTHLATIDGWPRRGIVDGLKKAVERHGGPRRFVGEVFAPMAEAYLQVRGATVAQPVATTLRHWLTGLQWLERHGDDDWVPLAMVGLKQWAGDVATQTEFLRALDRYAHGLMALGCGREARRRHYAPILKQMLEDSSPQPPGQLLAISTANQKTILRHIATRIHSIDPPTARLILFRADQAITGQPLAAYQALLDVGRKDQTRFTVEHICPKGAIKSGDWLRLFPKTALRQRLAQSIGNLALVTEAQNKRVNQNDFADKKWVFFPDGTASPFRLTDMLRSEKEWNADAIERRHILIMEAIKAMWQLEGPLPRFPRAVADMATTLEPPPDSDPLPASPP